MSQYSFEIEDDGDLVEIIYCCSRDCMERSAVALNMPEVLPWPCASSDVEYDVYCYGCGVLMASGPEREGCDAPMCRYGPVVVNLNPEGEEKCPNGHYVKVRAEYLEDQQALDRIQSFLTGREWDSSTIEVVADIVRETGRNIDPPG